MSAHETRLRVPVRGVFKWALIFGVVATGITFIAVFAMLAVGLAYPPNLMAEYLIYYIPRFMLIAVALGLQVYRGYTRPLGKLLSILTGLIGLVMAGAGFFMVATDPGDTLLYAGPAILGLCLIILAVEPKLKGSNV
ncbi:hypothetical protein [uncultured Roseobacter sp.]|uniref:hypothetical protein n=1 Tax=uncultured Roseobacter sp. TaxID=114847 RepID=UPI00260E7A86|nr:hypothetical protein [uncultured Roseobacter sp.]